MVVKYLAGNRLWGTDAERTAVIWNTSGTEGTFSLSGTDNQTAHKTSGGSGSWQTAFCLGSSAIGTANQTFKFSVNASNTHIASGISTISNLEAGNTDQDAFDWGFYLKADGNYLVYVDGTAETSDATYTTSTTFQIDLTPTSIIFKVNDVVVHTETTHLPNSGTTYNIAWNIYDTASTQLTALTLYTCVNGSIYLTSDTNKAYMFDGTSAWNEVA